jgi:hypothetical protein
MAEPSPAKMAELKQQVLMDKIMELSDNLGDPKRYFPSLRSAGLLDQSDCETIVHEVTTRDKVSKFLDIIYGRKGKNGKPAFDVLVNALVSNRVHLSIARMLQAALEKAVQEELMIAGENPDQTSKFLAPNKASLCAYVDEVTCSFESAV